MSHKDAEFETPGGAPYMFAVHVSEIEGEKEDRFDFVLTEKDELGREMSTVAHSVEKGNYHQYMLSLKHIAESFDLELPLIFAPLPEPTFETEFEELLTAAVHEHIQYGYGDPAIIRVDDENGVCWYGVSTSNDARESFPIIKSFDLKTWEYAGSVFPAGGKPEWAEDRENIADYWAPELHKVGGGYRVYFVARHKDTQELCIGVASSDKPAGPFQAAQAPLLRGNKIDPHVFVEETGESYLYWKEDNNDFWRDTLTELLFEHPEFIPILFPSQRHQKGVSLAITLWPWMKRHNRAEHFFQTFLIEAVTRDFYAFEQRLRRLLQESEAVTGMVNRILTELKTPFFVQQLSGDGFSLIGEKIKVLENDQSWEAHVIEGMWVTKRNRTYYMFYAGNNFATSDYAIGIASSESPLGPFKKKKEPFLGSTAKWLAPGHPSVAVGPDGKDRLFLHAYFPDQVGYRQFRAMLAVKLSFKGEWPEIEGIEEIKLPEQL